MKRNIYEQCKNCRLNKFRFFGFIYCGFSGWSSISKLKSGLCCAAQVQKYYKFEK